MLRTLGSVHLSSAVPTTHKLELREIYNSMSYVLPALGVSWGLIVNSQQDERLALLQRVELPVVDLSQMLLRRRFHSPASNAY